MAREWAFGPKIWSISRKRSRSSKKKCSSFGNFFSTLEINLKFFQNLTFILQNTTFLEDNDRKCNRFHEKDRVLAKKMSSFGSFCSTKEIDLKFFQNLTFFSLERDLVHANLCYLIKKYTSQPQLKVFCIVLSVRKSGVLCATSIISYHKVT